MRDAEENIVTMKKLVDVKSLVDSTMIGSVDIVEEWTNGKV